MLLTIVAAACGDSSRSPVAPGIGTAAGADGAALAGNWTGTIAIPGAVGTLRLTLTGPDAAGAYVGTWSAVFADSALNREGTLSADRVTVAIPANPVIPALMVNLHVTTAPTCTSPFGQGAYVLSLFAIARNRMSGDGIFGGCGLEFIFARVQLTR